MKDVWNLNTIYEGFTDPAFAADMEAMQNVVHDFAAFADGLETMETLEGLRGGIASGQKTGILCPAATIGQYPGL